MKKNSIRQNTFAITAALIWGTAFVAQSMAAEFVEPFTFNAARAFVGGFVLLPLWWFFAKRRKAQGKPALGGSKKDILLGGFWCGLVMTAAVVLQQTGIETTSSGKAGFVSALYIVIVPIIGIFLKKPAPKTVWGGVAVAVVGLYFLCVNESLTIAPGDAYLVACAFCFSGHILVIDHFTQKVDGVALACVQFFVAGTLASVGMLIWESPSISALMACALPILYVGVFSNGGAYTLQILAQKDSNPTIISLLLSLEAVFAVVAGALILGDQLSGREYVGCVLMLGAVVLAQLPEKRVQSVN